MHSSSTAHDRPGGAAVPWVKKAHPPAATGRRRRSVVSRDRGPPLHPPLPPPCSLYFGFVCRRIFFRFRRSALYDSKMTSQWFRNVLRTRNTSFPPHNTPTHILKNFSKSILSTWEAIFA